MSYPISKILHYIAVSIVCLTTIYGIIPLLVRFTDMTSALGDNLKAEFWGILFTVIIILLVIDLREYFQWRPVKDKVLETIGKEISAFSIALTKLCKCSSISIEKWVSLSKEDKRKILLTQLEELNEKVELNELGRKAFSKTTEAPVNFQEMQDNLSRIEAKYSRFLDSSLSLSLMEIQHQLSWISILQRIQRNLMVEFELDEIFFKLVSEPLHSIVKEIYKMYKEMEIGIL